MGEGRVWTSRCSVLWAVAWSACTFGPTEPEIPEVKAPLHPLGEAPVEAWLQEVWWTAPAGWRVLAVEDAGGATPGVHVLLQGPDGTRRTWQVTGPGQVRELRDFTPAGGRDGGPSIGPDRRTQARVQGDGELVVEDTLKPDPRVLVRDAGRVLRHPSFAADGASVFVDEGGAIGGIWQVSVADGGVRRVVPSREAASPVAWTDGGVVFVEERAGEPVHVVHAAAASGARSAAELVRGGEVASAWFGVLDGGDGALRRVVGCDGAAGLSLTVDDVGVRASLAPEPAFDQAWSCGEGCTRFSAPGPADAPRVVARLQAERTSWSWSFGDGATGRWVAAGAGDLPTVEVCPPALPDARYLPVVRHVGEPGDQLTALEPGTDRLVVHGLRARGRQPFVAVLPRSGGDRVQLTAKGVVLDPSSAAQADGSVVATVEAGALRWVGAPGPRELWPASGHRVTGLSVTGDGRHLLVTDDGEKPGLYRVAVADGASELLLPGRGLRAPVPTGRPDEVAWIQAVDGAEVVLVAGPTPERLKGAWQRGIAGLMSYAGRYVPVQPDGGRWARCEGVPAWTLTAAAGGARLEQGGGGVEVVGALEDGGVLRLLALGGGVPWVVAETAAGNTTGGAGAPVPWWGRAPALRGQAAPGWLRADVAEALPIGGRCRAN